MGCDMKLKVKDFARIKEGNINIGEITVIAGKNDTGKSTISKILYAIINGLSEEGREKFLKIYQKIKIDEITFDLYKKTSNDNFRRNSNMNFVYTEILIENLLKLIYELEKENDYSLGEERAELEKLKNLNIVDRKLKINTILEYFNSEFGLAFKKIFDISEFELKEEKEKKSYIKKSKNTDKWVEILKMTPFRNAIYLESPFINSGGNEFSHTKMVDDLIKRDDLEYISLGSQKDLIEEISGIIGGNYIVENSKIYLEKDGIKISNENIATGIKSLGQIKLLLEKGILKKDSFLILDEPEVHLHPEWQVKLAQIIGLLNRKLEIKILLNTHSSYFVEAIDIFKDYYKIGNVNYYLVELESGGSKFKEVTDDISQIYSSLSQQAYDMLDKFKSKAYFEEQENVRKI
jgi:predicted ATPase